MSESAGSGSGPAYWSPLATAKILMEAHGTGDLWRNTADKWEQRLWMSVPGPFYAGETDTGMNGPEYAPLMVLCGGDFGMEFVYRQPQTPGEVRQLFDVMWGEPFGGYAGDGDNRWTPSLVREWWAERGRLAEWITTEERRCLESVHASDKDLIFGLREFGAHVAGGLETYLRGYVFWLLEGREPQDREFLPCL